MTTETLEAISIFLSESLVAWGLNLLGAVAILVAGWYLSAWGSSAVGRAVARSPKVDTTLKPLASSLTRYLILAITLMATLARFGVQTASLVALLGAAGLAIGLALQGTLSNVASGVMLLVLRPFEVGDYIEVGGQGGTVLEITLFTTQLSTPNNIFVSLPNSSVFNAAIVNYNRHETRRIDLTIGIGYGDDIDKALAVALEVISADERVLADPAPVTVVRALGESSVDLAVRGFTKTGDYWPALFDLHRSIKQRFDAEDIEIPFPQRALTLVDGWPGHGDKNSSMP